jgi:hypothetical protein
MTIFLVFATPETVFMGISGVAFANFPNGAFSAQPVSLGLATKASLRSLGSSGKKQFHFAFAIC